MSSVQTHIKQQNILWAPLPSAQTVSLFAYDVSNQLFSATTVSVGSPSNLRVFRDLGVVHVSGNRTFRKVQLLTPGGAFVATGGVGGSLSSAQFENAYNTYYYENSIENGLATTSALFRIR
jgi:hypothetical protein